MVKCHFSQGNLGLAIPTLLSFVVVFALLLPCSMMLMHELFLTIHCDRSLWPKQGIDLQHVSFWLSSESVFWGEKSVLWDMVLGSSKAFRSDFTQNLYWELCRSWSYKIWGTKFLHFSSLCLGLLLFPPVSGISADKPLHFLVLHTCPLTRISLHLPVP